MTLDIVHLGLSHGLIFEQGKGTMQWCIITLDLICRVGHDLLRWFVVKTCEVKNRACNA